MAATPHCRTFPVVRTTAPYPHAPAWTLCRNCGAEYYPSDVPALLAASSPYGWCHDCCDEAACDQVVYAATGGAA